jgi:membrane protease YdiL (CAAX protease family)
VETPIGQGLRTPWSRALAGVLAISVVGFDLVRVWQNDRSYSGPRLWFPIIALAVYLVLVRGDLASAGLTFRPRQGLKYWMKASLVIGAIIASIVVAVAAVYTARGEYLPVAGQSLADTPRLFVRMCIVAPLVEEEIYRLALCTGAAAAIKSWGTVALSGATFAILHVLYGNPGPDNLVAGFFLSWAFLKSGSILVPVALHSIGNLFVLVAWVGLGYWRSGLLL